mgnify:CR=1 FL=1
MSLTDSQYKMQHWEEQGGFVFLKKIGIEFGWHVLDFGARVGHYSLPLAQAVGVMGQVTAVDTNSEVLEILKDKIDRNGLRNVTVLSVSDELPTPLPDQSMDAILAYDVLQLVSDRDAVYADFYRLLKPGAMLSVYPKHNKNDSPGWGLADLTVTQIKSEILRGGFEFDREVCENISHDDDMNFGCVLNFRKTME